MISGACSGEDSRSWIRVQCCR